MYKTSVSGVGCDGTGDFTSLREAVQAAGSAEHTIILLPGSYSMHWPVSLVHALSSDDNDNDNYGFRVEAFEHRLQIIGCGHVEIVGAHGAATPSVVFASGRGTFITLDNIELTSRGDHVPSALNVPIGLGIMAAEQAKVSLHGCQLSCISSCIHVAGGAEVTMVKSFVTKSASAVVAYPDGSFYARDSKFEDLTDRAIQIAGGCCRLEMCHFRDITLQALVINMAKGKGAATLTDCSIVHSGNIQSAHAVLVNDGVAVLERCKVEKNRGGGILLQAGNQYNNSTAYPEVKIIGCTINGNAASGIEMFGGKLKVCDSRIQENALTGIAIHYAVSGTKATRACILRNHISGNHASSISNTEKMTLKPPEISITGGRKCMERVTLEHNSGNTIAGVSTEVFDEHLAREIREGRHFKEFWELLTTSKELDKLVEEMYFVDAFTGHRMDRQTASPQGENFAAHFSAVERILDPAAARTLSAADIATVHFDKSALKDSHERMRSDQLRMQAQTTQPNEIVLPIDLAAATSSSRDHAKHRQTSADLLHCTIRDLCPFIGRHAPGVLLRGSLCVDAMKCASFMSVLVDNAGDAVRLSIYNHPCLGAEHWSKCFPKGMRLGVKEPLFKRSADGGFSLRVDDPRDLVFSTAVCSWRPCGIAETNEVPLKRCSRCKVAAYCCKEHQTLDWKRGGHPLECVVCKF